MKRWKKILGTILAAAVIVTGITVPECNVSNVKAQDYGISNPRIGEDGSVIWDKIKFGNYKQSVEFGEAEPIKWRILSIDDNNNALLLADKGLDCKQYNEGVMWVESYTDYSCTWETCTLRKWLNEDFYNEAFNESEQAEIKQVTVKNDDNPKYGTEGGNNTSDKVYLLSIEEASNSEYGFDSIFDTESVTRRCKVTDYAKINGARRISGSGYSGEGDWWLRSPGGESCVAANVYYIGWGYYDGYDITYNYHAIRPALQINLQSTLLEDAGEVASDGTVMDLNDGYNNPRVTDNGTVWDCVYFGRYKQNASVMEKEPIEWRVLSVDGDEALLLADNGLDCKAYNEENEDVTWETCTLRSWLNQNFYNEAFTEAEQAAIKQVSVENDDNPEFGTEGGNDTSDKLYLLSIEEASNSAYGFDSTFDSSSTTRECKVTDYAYLNGAWRNSNSSCYVGSWMLRSPGDNSNCSAFVGDQGSGYGGGSGVSNVVDAIRPALRIDLSSSVWEAEGIVSTEPGAINTDQSTQMPEPTEEPSKAPNPTDASQPTATPEQSKTPEATNTPDVTQAPASQPTATPVSALQPTTAPTATQMPVVSITNTQTQAMLDDNTQNDDIATTLKSIKLTSVKCKKSAKQISGKVSVSGAAVKIKVGSKAYKKATVKGKKFTLKVPRLKKNTKVTIKVTKSGYKSLVKTYKVK